MHARAIIHRDVCILNFRADKYTSVTSTKDFILTICGKADQLLSCDN